jgi:hypothetical protein
MEVMTSRRSPHFLGVLVLVLLTACSVMAPATPTPLPTLALFTHTWRPGDIASSDQLGPGPELAQICRDCLRTYFPADLDYAAGLKELRNSTYPDGLIPWFKYPPQGNYAFVNAEHTEFVEGFTVALKDDERQAEFDDLFVSQFLGRMQETLASLAPDTSAIAAVAVGDKSVGVTSDPTANGTAWRLNVVSFREGAVGAFVFCLHPAAGPPPNDVVKMAELYAASLTQ